MWQINSVTDVEGTKQTSGQKRWKLHSPGLRGWKRLSLVKENTTSKQYWNSPLAFICQIKPFFLFSFLGKKSVRRLCVSFIDCADFAIVEDVLIRHDSTEKNKRQSLYCHRGPAFLLLGQYLSTLAWIPVQLCQQWRNAPPCGVGESEKGNNSCTLQWSSELPPFLMHLWIEGGKVLEQIHSTP